MRTQGQSPPDSILQHLPGERRTHGGLIGLLDAVDANSVAVRLAQGGAHAVAADPIDVREPDLPLIGRALQLYAAPAVRTNFWTETRIWPEA